MHRKHRWGAANRQFTTGSARNRERGFTTCVGSLVDLTSPVFKWRRSASAGKTDVFHLDVEYRRRPFTVVRSPSSARRHPFAVVRPTSPIRRRVSVATVNCRRDVETGDATLNWRRDVETGIRRYCRRRDVETASWRWNQRRDGKTDIRRWNGVVTVKSTSDVETASWRQEPTSWRQNRHPTLKSDVRRWNRRPTLKPTSDVALIDRRLAVVTPVTTRYTPSHGVPGASGSGMGLVPLRCGAKYRRQTPSIVKQT